MNKNLAITVLTWNDWKNTVCCLESIYQSSYNNFDIILVNNNSDKYHIDKATKYKKIINNRSKSTLELDEYLEKMRNKDLKCCNNLSERLLKYHTEIESEQRAHVNNVIRYNDKLIKLKKLIKNENIDKGVLDLFMFDAIEHLDTINDIYIDGIKYGDSIDYLVKRDVYYTLNGIIDKIVKEDANSYKYSEKIEAEQIVNSQEELNDIKSIELIRIESSDSLDKLEL